eukprot:Nitzschia sp. Nitz4//scaffold344_size17659//14979//17054//NITZ4_008814-RA/size17659-snap-gene-0.31-mRNA-1//1//CDS//3329548621//8877//frame0
MNQKATSIVGESSVGTVQTSDRQPSQKSKSVGEVNIVRQPKPYFPIEPPDTDIVRQILAEDLPADVIPLQSITLTGCISTVRGRSKQKVFVDLAPLQLRTGISKDTAVADLKPWRCPCTNNDMAVQLIFDNQTDIAKDLHVGRHILIQGQTNANDRDSLLGWLMNQRFDVTVWYFQPLNIDAAGGQVLHLPTLHFDYLGDNHTLESTVTVVSSLAEINDLQKVLTNSLSQIPGEVCLIGFDCEWKPTFLSEGKPQVILLVQIWVHKLQRAFLLDLQTLLRPLCSASEPLTSTELAVSEIFRQIFCQIELVKVGFQVIGDFQRLAASYPNIPGFQEIHSVLEITTLGRTLPYREEPSLLSKNISLAKAMENVVGLAMDKSQQCSDWSKRPLSPEQIEYGALDALAPVLLAELSPNDHTVRKLRAKRVLGDTFVVSQSWYTYQPTPRPPTFRDDIGHEEDQPFVDSEGIWCVPTHTVQLVEKGDDIFRGMIGNSISKDQESCVIPLIRSPQEWDHKLKLDFERNTGYMVLANASALFITMPISMTTTKKKRPYPNKFYGNGQFVSWFVKEVSWAAGKSRLASRLHDGSNIFLFLRPERENYRCCGICALVESAVVPGRPDTPSKQNSIEMFLKLLDFHSLESLDWFKRMVSVSGT